MEMFDFKELFPVGADEAGEQWGFVERDQPGR